MENKKIKVVINNCFSKRWHSTNYLKLTEEQFNFLTWLDSNDCLANNLEWDTMSDNDDGFIEIEEVYI